MRLFACVRGWVAFAALCVLSVAVIAPSWAAPVPASPWTALHDELTRLAVASDQTHAAAGHVMAVGATVQAKTKAHKLTPAEIALEQASRSRILDLLDRVQQADNNIDHQFTANQTFIQRHHFSPRIESRQQDTVSHFDQSVTALTALQQKLAVANSRNNAEAWHAGLEQLQQLVAQWQPSAPTVSPKNTPWTTPHLKVRAPHLEKDDYIQNLSMFDVKPIELAYAGSTPIPAGVVWPILPTMSDAVVPGDTAASEDAALTPAIQAEAANLGHNPAKIYKFVHDSIAYVPYYGSLQGADFTLQSARGNDMDIASLLIALLRASNIPARYVYGTVQVPTQPLQNWLGGVPDGNAALSLLAQGGVPSQAVTNGGSITAVQMEHVWVEAYVDYVPSRGIVQQQSDTWVPLDASYKQYRFTAPLNIPAGIPFNTQGLLQQLQGSATINSNGQIQNLNGAAVQGAIGSYQQNIKTWLTNFNNPSVGTVLGSDTITPNGVDQLPSVLPYTLLTVAADLDSLPKAMRWQFRLNLFANATDQSNSAPQVTLQGDVVNLLGHRLSIGFRPSTADDSAVLASLFPQAHANGTPVLPSEYPSTVPAYLVNMTAQLLEDGQLVEDAGNTTGSSGITSSASVTGFPLGTPLMLESAAYDPSSQSWEEAGADTVNSGETHVVALDSGMTPGLLATQQAVLDALSQQLGTGNLAGGSYDSLTGVLLQQLGQNYFGLLDAYEQWMESNQQLVGFRRPSWARIATEVDPQYTQGIIINATFPGAQIRLDHLESAIVGAGGAQAAISYRQAATERLSVYSQTALQNSLQTILPNGNPVSAVHALATALNQGQALDDLNSATYATLSPSVTLSANEAPAVTNAVAVGQSVILSPNPVSISNPSFPANAWTGQGLLYQDPITGNSRFTVSNGATALWYDGLGTAWLAFATPSQLQNGTLAAITATRNLNVQLQAALGNNNNLPWTQFTAGNDLINGDLLTQLNAQTSSSQNLTAASPNLLPTAAGILVTDAALSQQVNLALDAPPVISSTPTTTASVTVPYAYTIQATSPQNKPLTYQLASGPSLINVTGSGNTATLSWSKPLLGSWPITLRVSDGTTFTTQSWTLTVSQGAPALQVSLQIQPQLNVAPGGTVVVQITTTGGLLPETASLTADGQPVQLTPTANADGSVSGFLDSSGIQHSRYLGVVNAGTVVGDHRLVASVNDGNQTVTQSNLYAVNDPADSNTAPIAQISAPVIDATLTSPTPITGTATAGDLSYYLLLLKPVGTPDSSYVQIGKGTTAVSNGQLGTLDPSTLQNGIYTLSLIVFNSQGQQSGTQETIEIDKQLKLGQFRISFTDISITAPGGMPITLTRTYDTTRASQALDFGYGWSATYQDVLIRKNVPTGYSWRVVPDPLNLQICLVPVGVHKIVITMSDGSLYNFRADNSVQCQSGPATPVPQVKFTSLDNNATLVANSQPGLDVAADPANNGIVDLFDGTSPWDPTSFTLTLINGTKYTLDQNFGIQQIKDKFGNTLTFSSNGIQSSDGQGISFTRDSQGRITQVTDIVGKSLSYSYDSNGNLAAVTDRQGNTSTFTYLAQNLGQVSPGLTPVPAHYLQSYTDGRGVTVSRFDYDNSGRLISDTDSQGRSSTLGYETQNNREIVKDKLGNTTVYTYDNDGNIVKKVDAIGNTWSYTYDASGNQISETDPLGHITRTTYGIDLTQPWQYNMLLSATDAMGNTNSIQYDTTGEPTSTTDAIGNITGYEYFGNGSLNINAPLGVQYRDRLDNSGNSVEVGTFGHTTLYGFDSNGKIVNSTDPAGITTSFSNDANGNPLSSQFKLSLNIGLPAAGSSTVMTKKTYDANNNVVTETDALGNITLHAYNANNQATSDTDSQGHVTQYRYDDNGNLTQTILADGSINSSAFDANNNKLSDTDAGGHITSYVYDALGRRIQVQYPDGSTESTQYDAAGNIIAATDSNGSSVTYTNDADGNAIAITDANRHTSSFTLDANGNLLTRVAPDGQSTSYQYDALNRLIQTTLPNGKTRTIGYNTDNTKASATDESGNTSNYQYDGASRFSGISLVSPNGVVKTSYGYDEAGNEVSLTDGNGHLTRWQFDVNRRMTGRTLPDGRQEAFGYDSIGNLLQHTAFDGTTVYMAYDSMGRVVLKSWPDGRQSRYTYTPTGKPASVTLGTTAPTTSGFQPTGTTTWTYDAMDRVSRVTYPNGQYIAYGYDNVGNTISRTTADGNWHYGYDANHNLTAVTDTTGKTTTYTYDVNNRLSKTVYPDGTTGYQEYDVDGHLVQIAWKNGQGALLNGTVYTLLPNGQRQTLNRYDANSQLSVVSVSYTNPSTQAVTTVKHWSLTGPARVSQYTYDYGQHLTQDQTLDYRHNTEYITAWTYDNGGNRLSQTKTATPIDASGNPTGPASTTTTAYSYDAADRLQNAQTTDATGSTTTTTFAWDRNGHLIQQVAPGQVTQFSWRSDNCLTQVQQGGSAAALQTLATYQCDDNGNRVQRTAYVTNPTNPGGPLVPQITNYLIDESYPYAEALEETQTTAAGQTTRTLYTWDDSNHVIGANQDTGAALGPVQSYYERDGLGSVITLSDPKGNVTQSYRYSAFGETYGVAPADTNPYRYTGEYADEVIGLQYNRARVYDATVGRFISLDSYDPPPQMVDLVNKYYYASGDPVDEIDPSGETTTTAEVTIANEQGQKIKVAEKEGAIGEFKKFLFGGSSNNPAGLIGQLIVDEAKGALEDMIMDSAFNGLSRTLQGTRVHLALEKRIKALNESLRKSPLFRNIEIRAEFFVNGSGDEVGRRARGSLGVDVIVFWHHERMLAFDLKLGRKMGRTRGNKLAALIGTNIIEISVHR